MEKQETIQIIPPGKIISIEFQTDMLYSLREGLEAERQLRSNLSDEEFGKLVITLMDFEKTCDIKDYSFRMTLYFLARFETQCKLDNVYEEMTQEEFQERFAETTQNP